MHIVPLVRERTALNVAVSAGILTPSQADRLTTVGVHRYNHNLETARSFSRPSPPNTLTEAERQHVLGVLRSE